MTRETESSARQARPRPPFDTIALVLQGGGALGAYQGGVYQALAEAGIEPDWIAGISIGAINAAIIAGNQPAARVEKLREFWQLVTGPKLQWPAAGIWASAADLTPALKSDAARSVVNQLAAARALLSGAPGFFAPRAVTPWLWPEGSIGATSYYDTKELRGTLERLIDFDRINNERGSVRLSIGAVNVRTGNFAYFDTTNQHIGPDHVMASGALPPGFPAVEIEGEHYWDGGLVSNTPLRWIVEARPHRDTLAFQVDLWSSRGEFPRNMAEVGTRQKEIIYSSRTRAASNRFTELQCLRNSVASLLAKVPAELAESPEYAVLRRFSERKVWNLIQLIYHAKDYEGDSKDYEFSRESMEDHWRAGYNDTVRTLRHPEVLQRPSAADGVFTFDVAEHE
jgi:NTE family protein